MPPIISIEKKRKRIIWAILISLSAITIAKLWDVNRKHWWDWTYMFGASTVSFGSEWISWTIRFLWFTNVYFQKPKQWVNISTRVKITKWEKDPVQRSSQRLAPHVWNTFWGIKSMVWVNKLLSKNSTTTSWR